MAEQQARTGTAAAAGGEQTQSGTTTPATSDGRRGRSSETRKETTYVVVELIDEATSTMANLPAGVDAPGTTVRVVGRFQGVDRDQARWAAVDATADLKRRSERRGEFEAADDWSDDEPEAPRLAAVPERAWTFGEFVLEPVQDTRRVMR